MLSLDFMGEGPEAFARGLRSSANLIVFRALIKAKGLQSPGTNFMDKTLKHHYKPHFWSCPTSGT